MIQNQFRLWSTNFLVIMKSNQVINFVLFFSIFGIVWPDKLRKSKWTTDSGNEKSIALAIAPNRHCSQGISTWGTPIDGAGSLSLKQRHLLVYPHTNGQTAMTILKLNFKILIF